MTVYTVTKVFTDRYDEPQCEEIGVYHKVDKAQKALEKKFIADFNKLVNAKTNPDCLVCTWLDRFYAEINTRAPNPLKPSTINQRHYRYYIAKLQVK